MLGFCGITSAPTGSSGAAGVGVLLYHGAVQRLAPGEWGASAALHCCFHVAIRMLPCNKPLLFLAPISFLSLPLEPSGFLSQSPLLFKKFLFLFFFQLLFAPVRLLIWFVFCWPLLLAAWRAAGHVLALGYTADLPGRL